MKIWKNTNTLDGLVEGLEFTGSQEEADIALLGSKPISLEGFPNLRGIFRAGIGRDNVPVEEARKKGIKVAFPPDETVRIIHEETACFTCGLIFRMAYRDVGSIEPWKKRSRPALRDKVLLVIGKGNIGGRVAEKMGIFMKVLTYDIAVDQPEDLDGMLRKADIVSLHIPMTDENRDLMGSRELGLMKDGACLINTSRGGIVSEDDLYSELEKGRLWAAFDVFWKEPYEGKLKRYHPDRFFMTPHVASTCEAFLKGTAEAFRSFIEEVQND